MRKEAIIKSKEMFDTGDFGPANLEEVKSAISSADQYMYSAITNLVTLKSNLGIKEEKVAE